MVARALVVLAPGAEEMEATITIDVLRRAGMEVVVAGLDSASPVRCSRQVCIVPDTALSSIQDVEAFDVLVLPGGAEGARRLARSTRVGEILRVRERSERLTAAICAAPSVLLAHGVYSGKKMTSHPSVRQLLEPYAVLVDSVVVEDGPLITSQGPGTTFAFALSIVNRLCGPDAVDDVRAPMMLRE